jgi:hypothetical protein
MSSDVPPYSEKVGPPMQSYPYNPYQPPQPYPGGPGSYQPVATEPPPGVYQDQPGAYYSPGQQGQQPPQVVVVPNQPTVIIQAPAQSFVGHIVLSCFAFWCCGFIFGLIAFILASKSIDYLTDLKVLLYKAVIHL